MIAKPPRASCEQAITYGTGNPRLPRRFMLARREVWHNGSVVVGSLLVQRTRATQALYASHALRRPHHHSPFHVDRMPHHPTHWESPAPNAPCHRSRCSSARYPHSARVGETTVRSGAPPIGQLSNSARQLTACAPPGLVPDLGSPMVRIHPVRGPVSVEQAIFATRPLIRGASPAL